MMKENVNKEKSFCCHANAETHICLWQGDQVQVMLSPEKINGQEWYSSYQLRVDVRDVSWFHGFAEYGEWKSIILRAMSAVCFLEELKEAITVLTSDELPEHSDGNLDVFDEDLLGSKVRRYHYSYDREGLAEYFTLQYRPILNLYTLTVGYKLLMDVDADNYISDTVNVSIKEITKEDLQELFLCLSIFLAHKEELRLINITYLEKKAE